MSKSHPKRLVLGQISIGVLSRNQEILRKDVVNQTKIMERRHKGTVSKESETTYLVFDIIN